MPAGKRSDRLLAQPRELVVLVRNLLANTSLSAKDESPSLPEASEPALGRAAQADVRACCSTVIVPVDSSIVSPS
jgi:hypothetical protein